MISALHTQLATLQDKGWVGVRVAGCLTSQQKTETPYQISKVGML
jgi:hypothetical protein